VASSRAVSTGSATAAEWVPVQVGADQAGQQLEAGPDHVAERQGTAGSGRHPLSDPDRVVEIIEHLGDQAGEDPAGLGELDGPRRSLEQPDLKLPLEILDGFAEPGRRHHQAFGRTGEAELFRDREERPVAAGG
jgi:hypothetical protein